MKDILIARQMIKVSVHKRFRSSGDNFNLQIDANIVKGSFTSLYGISGAGKTTLLRLIAGLIKPDSGHIEVNNRIWCNTKKSIFLSPQKRDVGLVFQNYSLFPNMTIRENLEFALKKGDNQLVIDELIDVMDLDKMLSQKPSSLSGGQQQRVALARALVNKPDLLLLDEPLSALDEVMRSKLQDYIISVHHRYELTTLLVSHDKAEILKTSDRILVIEDGTVIGDDAPLSFFNVSQQMSLNRIQGVILSMERFEESIQASILIHNDVIRILLTPDEAKDYQHGEKVYLSMDSSHIQISKEFSV